jgi:hypothetical protein
MFCVHKFYYNAAHNKTGELRAPPYPPSAKVIGKLGVNIKKYNFDNKRSFLIQKPELIYKHEVPS